MNLGHKLSTILFTALSILGLVFCWIKIDTSQVSDLTNVIKLSEYVTMYKVIIAFFLGISLSMSRTIEHHVNSYVFSLIALFVNVIIAIKIQFFTQNVTISWAIMLTIAALFFLVVTMILSRFDYLKKMDE